MHPSVHAAGSSAFAPYRQPAPPAVPAPAGRAELVLDQVRFVPATGALLRRIAPLREEIALPAHVRGAPAFARLEKKETSWASWAPSSAWAASSGPSASCR